VKYPTKQFKNLTVALKELEPFIRDSNHLESGKPFKSFGLMRSREVLANWLLCVVMNAERAGRFTFHSDPVDGDGIIRDEATGETWPTEHVMVPRLAGQSGNAEALILDAIDQKRAKGGSAYAKGKTLVVLLHANAGMWFPNKVARRLPRPLHFGAMWVVGLQGVIEGEYIYGVANLHVDEGDAPTFHVRVSKNFDAWRVTRVQ
jgi:hypothetical protein